MIDTEIGRCLVDGLHVDSIQSYSPSIITLWHDGDYVVLTGNASFVIDVYDNGALSQSSEASLEIGELIKVENAEGTIAHPHDWDTIIRLIDRGDTASVFELSVLKRNWLRGDYIGDFILDASISALIGGVLVLIAT